MAEISVKETIFRDSLSQEDIHLFHEIIYEHYREKGRKLPWRETREPYFILVSEIMLQQTPVERVIEKYRRFIATFPDFSSLAKAPLHRILEVWQGLGYNRRALALKRIAEIVIKRYDGILPSTVKILMTFPGIGRYTASAINAFAFNKPTVIIETNIRSVFIHFFFHARARCFGFEKNVPIVDANVVRILSRIFGHSPVGKGLTEKRKLEKRHQIRML